MFGCAAPAALVPTEAAACFAPPTTRACTGAASAARVSYGARHDTWHGLIGRAQTPSRHESERLTVTVVLYNIVVGGVPSEADVLAAVDDLERLYAACRASSRTHKPMYNVGPGWTAPAPPPAAMLAPEATPITPPNPFANPPPSTPPVNLCGAFPTPQPPSLPPGALPFAPFTDVPSGVRAQIGTMPVSLETVNWVMRVALQRLEPPNASRENLGSAFALFRLASEVHAQLDGAPSPTALYNMACCLSRLAAKPPPMFEPQPALLVLRLTTEQCLNGAVSWLRAAAAAGWKDFGHMQTDGDLAAVRAQRATYFATAVKMSEAVAGGL